MIVLQVVKSLLIVLLSTWKIKVFISIGRSVMNLIKNIFLSIGLVILILGWMIALPFLMLYDKLFGGWRKDSDEEKY